MDQVLNIELKILQGDECVWPISVHCHTFCNLVFWKTRSCDVTNLDEAKKRIAFFMDRLGDLLRDYQIFAPVIALIELSEESLKWSQLIGDQDWHRGRFALQAVKVYRNDSLQSAKSRWLGPLESGQYNPRKVTTIDFVNSLEAALVSSKPPKDADKQLFSRFVDNLISTVGSDRPEEFKASWSIELVNDINGVLGKPVLEMPLDG